MTSSDRNHFGEKFLQLLAHRGKRENSVCVEEHEKCHKLSLTEGLIESGLADDSYSRLLLRCRDALFIVRQAEVKWKIIAISVCIDYKLISAVCVAHKAALSRTDDFIHFH